MELIDGVTPEERPADIERHGEVSDDNRCEGKAGWVAMETEVEAMSQEPEDLQGLASLCRSDTDIGQRPQVG